MSGLIELLLICLFVITQSLKDDTHQRPNLCALPREPGACKESINRWYFDSDDNVCKQFEYTGCAGNGNNFDTESLCQKTCLAGSVTTAPEQNCAQKRKALVTKGHLTDDSFVPNCTPDGSYSASQCNNNGQCFCVNPKTGEEISGTRTDSEREPGFCEGSKKCPNEPPLTDIHGVNIYCGSGSNHQDCPDGYECNKHPGGLYAVCCKHEDSPTVVPKVVQHAGDEELKTKQQAPLQDKRGAQEPSSHPSVGNLVDNPIGEIQKWGKCSTNNTDGYSPRCTSEGHYQWIQCESEKNNTCWCVDPESGEELIGTRKNELVSCVDCYSNGPLLSNFKPQCEIPLLTFKQTYTECPSYVTTCGCMDINTGKDIEGSTVGPGDKFPSCTFMPTFRGSCNVTAMTEPEFRGPACGVSGFFSPMQCEIKEGVGYSCFCVDPTNMAEIQGTRFYAIGKQIECPKCLMSKFMALNYLSIGAFVPQCTETGEFNPLQCNNRTGVCFCVYTDGTIVPGTRKSIENGLPHCQVANKSSIAFDQFASNPVRAPQNAETSTISESPKSGQPQGKCVSVPGSPTRCTQEGFYDFVQCDGHKDGYCWCVNPETNVEVDGTRKSGNLTCLECLATGPLVINFLPRCDFPPKVLSKLNNNNLLCPTTAKSCGCLDVTTGATIPGHDVAGGQPMSSCEFLPAVKGPCNVNDSSETADYKVQCTKNGFFVPVQCDQNTNCWCVDPENNKEIKGTRVKQPSATPSCTKCLLAKAMAFEFFPFAFLPQCTENGDFVPLQCDNKTGSCFCVNVNGTIVPGTRQKDGSSKRPDCTGTLSNAIEASIDDSSACLRELQTAQEKGHLKTGPHATVAGGFIPRCTKAGTYEPLQCHGSTGFCWCVTENGTEISGTRSAPGKTRAVCRRDEPNEEDDPSSPMSTESSTPCKSMVESLGENPPPGTFVPNCTESGFYHPMQCHQSTGYCWCVTEDGKEINGTRIAPGNLLPVCERKEPIVLTSSRTQHAKPAKPVKSVGGVCAEKLASLGDNYPPGTLVPNCTETGNFQPLQCHPSTGHCWCVTENGTEIEGTNVGPGKSSPVCDRNENVLKEVVKNSPPCLEDLRALYKNVPPGAFVPNCTESGYYQPMQCHPSTGQCWCVKENGAEIEGTRIGPGSVAPLCERNEPVNALDLSDKGRPCKVEPAENSPPGSFVPRCTESGFYEPLQCHGSTGQCWCSTSEGTEIKGTRTLPGHGQLDCTSNASASGLKADVNDTNLGAEINGNGPCRKKLNSLGDKIPIGAFVPQCKDNGDYHAKQCHGSTGFCWCVSSNGTEIPGTKKAAGNGTVSCTFEIDDVLVGPSIEQPPGETIKTSGSNPCDLPKDAGIYCDNGSNSTNPQTRWYFSTEKNTCLAFKYAGCAGNENNFQSTSDCDVRCRPQDGPTCNGRGNSRPYTTNVTMTGPALGPGHAPKRLHCDDVQCPSGFKCKMGWMSPACCNETVEKLFDEAYDPMCSNDRKAYSVKSESNFRSPFFGDSCKDLLCPKGYMCNQTNFMFAKCCPTADFVEDEEPKKEEIAVCPTGTPIKDFAAGGYRLCNAESSCPNSSFCWNVSHPHERNVQGVCCPSPKIPPTLRKVLAKQNCTLETREHIQECLKPFENITKKFSSLSISSPANVGELFPENATIVSLNQTCSKYQGYKLCTKDIYKPTYCYDHKSQMVDEILGFACKPETIEVFLKNKHCLEDIIKDDAVKQCVIQFAQTLRLLSEGGARSFGGLCSSIERFIECVKPSITSNCSSDIFGLMREFVNRTVGVVFGGTCQEVIDSERAELIHETLPDFGCTVEQTKSLTVCTQTFVESPVVAKNFPAQAEPISILITKQQLDSLDLFCAAYKVYEVCAQPVILTDTKCKPFLYQALENVVGFNCKEDIVKQWKKHGPCLSKLTNRTDVIQCFEILANVQKGLNTSKGVDPPLDKLCAQMESHIKCMEKPVSDQCGKDTYQFYSLVYANSKRFLFSPCYQLQEDSSTQEQQEVEVPVGGTAEASIDAQTAAVPASGTPKSVREEMVSSAVTIVTKLESVASANDTADERACILRRDSMLWASTVPAGQYIPQCNDNGDYKPVQCDPAKGTCWCVNEITGEEIQGTLVHSSDNKTASCGPCHNARADALAHSSLTKFVPVCQENGKYHHLQCSIETGDCWCVDAENGTEISGSKVGPGKKLPTCGVKEVYACTRLALKSSCMPDSSKPQEVFRWYRDGDKCKIYRFNYCEMEAHVPPYPLKEQKDCERLCIGKQSDFVPVPT